MKSNPNCTGLSVRIIRPCRLAAAAASLLVRRASSGVPSGRPLVTRPVVRAQPVDQASSPAVRPSMPIQASFLPVRQCVQQPRPEARAVEPPRPAVRDEVRPAVPALSPAS
jgi:hypothetical protein